MKDNQEMGLDPQPPKKITDDLDLEEENYRLGKNAKEKDKKPNWLQSFKHSEICIRRKASLLLFNF